MVPLDERILEILQSEGWSTAGYIARKVSLFASAGRVRERCRMLTAVELIEPHTKRLGHFDIANRGIQYLKGEFDASDLPKPNPGTPVRC
jgi:DNA-binding Lrp family transcriptional regulator